jgi:hypothetical protein
MSIVAKRTASVLERVRPIYYKQAFFLIVFGYIALMMWDAQSYGATVRLFPVLIGIPLLGLLLVQLLFPVLPDGFKIGADGLMSSVTNSAEIDTNESTTDRSVRMQREFLAVLWTLALLGIVYLFGFLAGLTLFVAAFIYYYERNLKLALGVMVVNLVVSYVLFVQILQIRLFPGAIW